MTTGYGTSSIAIGADIHGWLGGVNCETSDGSLQVVGATEQLVSTLGQAVQDAGVEKLLLLGDLVCGGGSYQMPVDVFLQTHTYVREQVTSTGIATHVLPGNHDSRPGTGGTEAFEAIWSLQSGLGQTIELPHVRLVMLNAQGHARDQLAAASNGDPVYGWVSKAELHRLDRVLSAEDERPIILLTHQLLQPWGGSSGWRDFYAIKNADKVLDMIDRAGNVRAVVQAHAHRLDFQHVSLGQSECAFLVVPALVEFPIAWTRLDIARDSVRFRMQSLPLPDLREATRRSGSGQDWRVGLPEWQDFTVALT